ncbi:MAG TPA: DNA/RNA non-specific endonuclease [Spirochaetota bacterium]|nr:DNA/RNA non-specific endonuclease [Spirochaetota bacterium]HSA13732.1 DNA/RNA non-specific endonuclease [Spirochaetota bacterium]
MKKLIRSAAMAVTVAICCSATSYAENRNNSHPEIHCKHFILGYPTGTPASNDLIIRDIYALSSNDETKFADWVAYRLDKTTVTGAARTSRQWKRDPWLDPDETLVPAEYEEAPEQLKVDRGHQAPLASFKGTSCWHETNYLSNITPQKSSLNQGPWQKIEDIERKLTGKFEYVYVMTGPLYKRTMPALPGTAKKHRIPSGYWKIIIITDDESGKLMYASFIFDQDSDRADYALDHLVTIETIEKESGLDFLREIEDEIEEKIENDENREWAEKHFSYRRPGTGQ